MFLVRRNILLIILVPLIHACGLEPSFKTIQIDRSIKILDCTKSFADNYNQNATEENGTCEFTRCLDQTQDNFNASNLQEINEYINQYQLDKNNTLLNNCNGRSACIHNLSKNKDPQGTKENGTCLFNACMDENYHEYVESDFKSIDEYIIQWGETFQNQLRINSTCKNKRRFCKNPEASNFTGLNESRGDPYCIFHACTKAKFEGYKKYQEFQEFLRTHPGEIIEDNSNSRCGPRIVSKNIKELDVNKQALKTPVDVVFVIDDSSSMGDEVDRVKDGLITLAPTLKNFNSEINMEFHKISQVNNTTKVTMLSNTQTSKIQKTEYLRPKATDSLKIDGKSDLATIEKDITRSINKVMDFWGNGHERGACYVQRILDSFKTDSNKNLITILISDEDDHELGSSKNCYTHTIRDLLGHPNLNFEHFPYKDSTGKDDLINVITEGVVNLDQDKKFGFSSIHWNEQIANCPNELGSHAESYIRLVDQLKNHKKISIEGDICEKEYGPLLDKTLADTIREIIGYKYYVASLDKNPVVDKVEIITIDHKTIELTTNDYELVDDGVSLYIKIDESLSELLKNSSKIRIHVIEEI